MAFIESAFLAGLAALAVPVLIHLLFRRRAKRVDLGTLRFLKVVIGRNSRRRRLKWYLLLCMRLALVALLVGLFARPYLLASATVGSDAVLAVLIDASASMSLGGGDERPVDQAAERLDELQQQETRRRVESAVFDSDVRSLEGEFLSPEEATFGATDFGRALSWGADRCAASSGAAGCEIVLLTDLQRSGLDSLDAPLLSADLPVRIIDVGRPVANNLALTAVTPRRTIVRPGEPVTLTASVLNAGPFAAREISIAVRLSSGGARRTLRKQIDIPPGETKSIEFDLPELAAGLWSGSATVEARDDLSFDDVRHFAILAARKDKILIASDTGRPGTATHFLGAALRLAPPGSDYPEAPYEPVQTDFAALPQDLSPFRVIVLANPPALPAAAAERLARFANDGGGLLVFTGGRVTADATESLRRLGLTPGRIEGTHEASGRLARMTRWEAEHPLFAPFADALSGDLRTLAFDAYTVITPAKDANVLASFGDEPAIIERAVGQGRVIWFASSADREWGDWTRSGLFVPLLYQMLGHLTGLTDGGPVRAITLGSSKTNDPATKPGVYTRRKHAIVVNTDPRESDLDRCTPEEFAAKFGLTLAGSAASEEADSSHSDRTLRRDELWPWMLICVMGLLLAEGLLANRTEA